MSLLGRTIRSLADVSDSPERTAFAFGVGVFIGFSPFLGLHTVMAVGAAILFRLNRLAVLLGAWLNVPWIIPPYYGFATWLGVQILGTPQGTTLPNIGLFDLFEPAFWTWLASQWRFLIPAFVGSTILSLILAFLAYPLALILVRRLRARRPGWPPPSRRPSPS